MHSKNAEAAVCNCSSKKVFLKILEIHKKAPVLESLFVKVASLKAINFIKQRFQHRCFPANITKYLRISFFIEQLWWLLLKLKLYLTLQASVSQNGQTHSNSSSATANELFVCDKRVNFRK